MAVQHEDIVDPYIHEPKGIATANSGDVYVADGLGSGAWEASAHNTYADIYITGGATAQALSAASAYAVLNPGTEWTQGLVGGITTVVANGEISLDVAGIYQVSFWASFDTAAIAANVQYYFKYALDGTPGARIVSVQKNTANVDHLNVSASGILSATAGQLLSIHVAGDATSSSTNITVTDAGFSVHLIEAS